MLPDTKDVARHPCLEQFSKWLTFRKPPISASCSGSGRSPEVVPPPAAGIIHFEKCFRTWIPRRITECIGRSPNIAACPQGCSSEG